MKQLEEAFEKHRLENMLARNPLAKKSMMLLPEKPEIAPEEESSDTDSEDERLRRRLRRGIHLLSSLFSRHFWELASLSATEHKNNILKQQFALPTCAAAWVAYDSPWKPCDKVVRASLQLTRDKDSFDNDRM